MRRLAASTTYAIPFSTSQAPDALPTATAYADTTSLGAATVAAITGVNAYSVSVSLPSNVTAGQVITVAIDWLVGSVAQCTARLMVGQVLAAEPTASQTAAAVASQVRTELAAELGRLDTTISSRLADASYVPPDNAGIATAATQAAAAAGGVATLVGRVTSSVATLWSNLSAMIVRSDAEDAATAAFTEVAMANGGGGSGTGSIRVAFLFQRSDESAVSAVKVSVPGTDAVNYTGTNGTTFLMLDPSATYSVRVSPPPGYQAIDDFEVEVGTSDPEPIVVELTAFTGTIGPEGTCTLSFRVASQSDTNLEGVVASAKIVGPTGPRDWIVKNLTVNLNVVESAPSDENGNISIVLLPDQDYDLSVQRPGHTPAKIRIRTPNSPTATLPQVIEV